MPHRMGLCITIRRPRYGYLAITFPRLEYLTLGQWPCGVNACPACKLQRTPPLFFFPSAHCQKSKRLGVWFPTTNMLPNTLATLDYA